jgi:cytochrome c peroxidase
MRRWVLAGLLGSLPLCGNDIKLAPLAGKPPFPPGNPPTPAKVELGKKLFFDNRLSGPGNRSCGTCHRPELMYSDGLSRAWGLKETELRRRTPMLFNVGWQQRLFHDARAGSLEEQAAFPLKNEFEMDLDPQEAVERLRRDSSYQKMFQEAFPGRELKWELVAEALATFQRTLVSYDSDVDRYLAGDPAALSAPARRGLDLFTGRAGCAACHNGPLLTDQKLHYIGVPEEPGDGPPGTPYKTPSLRDAALRGSYMHNGYFRSLEAVLEFYQTQGTPRVKLEPQEKADLIAFLRSLNGRTYEVDLP